MNIKLFVLTAATVCGLAAEDALKRITANVPFGFESNGVKMAAGWYEVSAPTGSSLVKVRSVSTGKTIVAMAGPVSENTKGVNALEFKRYNDVYFLTALKLGSAQQKIALPYSRREKEMAIAIKPEVILAMGK